VRRKSQIEKEINPSDNVDKPSQTSFGNPKMS